MAKIQVNVRMTDETAEMARQAAETRHMPLNDYIEQLVRRDNDGVRERFLEGAREVITGYGDLIEELAAADR
ncbi:hypothetical protein LO772_00470 [Yinghuangia sp. ASG 101]|uniref:hypothetical protein n=1 Tax=Yinghuangia sp. ASG 101 TaxID=2896848 RepID=UPI001E645CB4|nr:hypothetical protein [Yinghuangia sp. ASG 101]UGQ12120.1 hypothetical protein LO772_00470 [Yinghuangia sp. ASG 101]